MPPIFAGVALFLGPDAARSCPSGSTTGRLPRRRRLVPLVLLAAGFCGHLQRRAAGESVVKLGRTSCSLPYRSNDKIKGRVSPRPFGEARGGEFCLVSSMPALIVNYRAAGLSCSPSNKGSRAQLLVFMMDTSGKVNCLLVKKTCRCHMFAIRPKGRADELSFDDDFADRTRIGWERRGLVFFSSSSVSSAPRFAHWHLAIWETEQLAGRLGTLPLG